jgi:hypothetical protein
LRLQAGLETLDFCPRGRLDFLRCRLFAGHG